MPSKRLTALMTLALAAAAVGAGAEETRIVVDATAPGRPFPHFWERMFGSGRAALTLRESYRDDLRAVRKITGHSRLFALGHSLGGIISMAAAAMSPANFAGVVGLGLVPAQS